VPASRDIALTTLLGDSGLFTPLQSRALASLGLTNIGKLVAYLPLRHERHEAEAPIASLAPGAMASARGEVTAVRPVRGRAPRLEAVLMDETGRLDLVWFNGLYMIERVRPGIRLRVHGKVQQRGPQLQMINPRLETLSPAKDEPELAQSRLRPVYSATEDVTSAQIEKHIAKALPHALPLLVDHLPEEFRRDRDLPSLAEAYRAQHEPASLDEVARSRRRLAYDELLLLQLGVHMKRAQLRETLRAPACRATDAIDARIRARIPFRLTEGQESVIADLRADLTTPTPGNRLIQGDVGSGKTAVALYAMLLATASGHQASLMAPTEILAEQHLASIAAMLTGSRVRVELLTGGTPQGERDAILAGIARGEVDILIGTHALLSDDVRFKSLALAIIDEQHRFGVSQRATLRAGASDEATTPHVLVMTATPIPRSLAMTLFGDLDISTIHGLPPGRAPIATRVVSSHDRRQAYDELAARVAQGQQGYIVAPAIEPGQVGSGGTVLADVRTLHKALEDHVLPGKRVGVLHGDLKRATREATMERFRLGQIDAIVATTVIEVGVDVPNATIMIVEQADRFGLAQLHQLRGRVGRGDKAGVCYLVADPTTEGGEARLRVLEDTTDGFVLAEKDLEIRGMGELFGVKQSGLPPFKVADPQRDRELLSLARRDASEWIARSPRLDGADEALLRRRLMKAHGKFLGLGDVG
jgi:ATP-dependent DNA helicase RecG